MFRLVKFEESPSGVDVAIIYDMNNGKQNRVEKHFDTPQIANSFVQTSEKKYLLEKLSKFILHKKIQCQTSKTWCNGDASRKTHSLNICLNNLDKIQGESVKMIANVIIMLKEHLTQIVSDSEQPWTGEYNKLDDLIKTCEEYINAKRKTIA